jgi:outer membrane lipoprotein-sorting protein
MNRITVLLTSVLLIFTTASFAQDDKKSREVLNGVSAKYRSFTSIKTSFTLTLDNPTEKISDTQHGTLYLKGNKYRIEISGQEIISDGKNVWTYMKDANEVQISDLQTGSDAITPTNIFTMYEKGYMSKLAEEKTIKGQPVQIIELVPVDKKKTFFKVQLIVTKNDKLLQSVKIFDKNGNRYTYSIEKFTPNGINTDNAFTFNKINYPGVEIVDLR